MKGEIAVLERVSIWKRTSAAGSGVTVDAVGSLCGCSATGSSVARGEEAAAEHAGTRSKNAKIRPMPDARICIISRDLRKGSNHSDLDLPQHSNAICGPSGTPNVSRAASMIYEMVRQGR